MNVNLAEISWSVYFRNLVMKENTTDLAEPIIASDAAEVEFSPTLSYEDSYSFSVDEKNENGKLTYPIGLLTSDEFGLAGAAWEKTNSLFYFNASKRTYAMNPAYLGSNILHQFSLRENGHFESDWSSGNYGARLAISLIKGVRVKKGDGTSNNPYVIRTFK